MEKKKFLELCEEKILNFEEKIKIGEKEIKYKVNKDDLYLVYCERPDMALFGGLERYYECFYEKGKLVIYRYNKTDETVIDL